MRRIALFLGVLGLVAGTLLADAGERVDVTAMDGVQLIAELDGASGPGVVLVPDAGEDASAWQPAASAVAERGFRVLRLDLRGRGASDGAVDLAAADRDVEGAARYLLGRKIRPLFLVGKGATATAVARVAARVPTAGVVLVGAGGAPEIAAPVLRLESIADPGALSRLTAWLDSLH